MVFVLSLTKVKIDQILTKRLMGTLNMTKFGYRLNRIYHARIVTLKIYFPIKFWSEFMSTSMNISFIVNKKKGLTCGCDNFD